MRVLYAGDEAAYDALIMSDCDCSPHWAAHFQPWAHYKNFWQQALRWLGRKG